MTQYRADAARLFTRLQGYRPATRTEQAHKTRMLNLLRNSGSPFNRLAFSPGHFTVSAAIVAPETGRIALIHNRHLNRWLQPGGHVEPGDADTAATAVREAQEELGLVLDSSQAHMVDLDVHSIPALAEWPRHLHFDIRYAFWHQEAPLREGSDATVAAWFAAAEASKMTRNRGLQRLFAKCERGASKVQEGL